MPTQIEQIKSLHCDSDDWYAKYPWFSIGQLIHTNNQKEIPTFWSTAQKTAIFFNDTQRLHYLLHEKPINKSGLLRQYNIGIVGDAQEMPQQVQTKLAKQTTPEIHLEEEIIEEINDSENIVLSKFITKVEQENEIKEAGLIDDKNFEDKSRTSFTNKL